MPSASRAAASDPPSSRSSTTGRPRAPGRALALPLGCAVALTGFGLLLPQHPGLFKAFVGGGGALLAWVAALWVGARRASAPLELEVAIYKHHWVQACAQSVVILYWGWHVRFVYAFLPLVLAQLVFAYGFESLLHLWRRGTYRLGFGPFPVVLSINLFLWFRPEWFHWQFVMIALGYLGKELVRWQREGRLVHIFNPSSFPLAVFSIILILTGSSELTLGTAIASSQFYPPDIYLVIVLSAVPGMLLFGVGSMTLSAVVIIYALSLVYFAATGTYLFYDTHIPIAIFLGMHLLFTDPSTSPRSESGRVVFGALYAVGTVFFYTLLGALGVPTFYDKLLPVPLMNLMVRRIDRLMASDPFGRLSPARIGAALTPLRRYAAYTFIWIGVFLVLRAAGGVGDRPPGQSLIFWLETCEEGNSRACQYADAMTRTYCNNGSGWACNEWAVRFAGEATAARTAYERACELGFTPGCDNLERGPSAEGPYARSRPRLEDLPIVLRGTKPPLEGVSAAGLRALACEQGWPGACGEGGWGDPSG